MYCSKPICVSFNLTDLHVVTCNQIFSDLFNSEKMGKTTIQIFFNMLLHMRTNFCLYNVGFK